MDNDTNIIRSWEANLYNSINNIADYEMQKLAWLGKHPVYVFSFDEAVMMLYDDNVFEEYLLYYKNKFGSDDLLAKMEDLNIHLKNYQPDMPDIEILQDPKWISITQKAKEVVDYWRLHKP